MTDVYIESGSESESETQWRLYTASERPVNTSRFQIESKAQIMKLCLRETGPVYLVLFFPVCSRGALVSL